MSGKRRRRRKTSDLILLALGLFAFGFIVAMTVIFCVKGTVPDTLIQYTLGAGGRGGPAAGGDQNHKGESRGRRKRR